MEVLTRSHEFMKEENEKLVMANTRNDVLLKVFKQNQQKLQDSLHVSEMDASKNPSIIETQDPPI
jgi:hypothetical protein